MSSKGTKGNMASNISETIFIRWCEKLNSEKDIPDTVVETIQKLYKDQKLKNSSEILKLIKKIEILENHED